MRRFKKIMIGVLIVLLLIVWGVGGTYFYLNYKGQKQLKESEVQDREGTYITYQGKEYRYNDDMINILFMGIDKKGGIEEEVAPGVQGLADSILLVSLDTTNDNLFMWAIPRDTMAQLRRTDEAGNFAEPFEDKITLQYGYGNGAQESCELMEVAVSNLLFKLPIQRYVSINMDAVPIVNDAVGGVSLTALETVANSKGIYFNEGDQVHLMGQDALNYIQVRDTNQIGSAMGRLNRQKQYVEAFYHQAIQAVKQNIGLPVTLYNELKPYMYTNLTLEDVTYLGTEFLQTHFSMENLKQIPGEAVYDENYHGGRTVFHVNYDELQKEIIDTYYTEVKEDSEE